MSRLRHDLLTSGWSMLDTSKFLERFNQHWHDTPALEFRYWHLLPQVAREFVSEMDWLLHEALPDEQFKAIHVQAISDWSAHRWHTDGTYLTLLFACRGEGTWVARGFEDNLATPHGYSLVMSGIYRRRRVKPTWHTSPHSAYERRLLLVSFF